MVRNGIFFLLLIFLFSFCKDKVKQFNGFTQKEMEYLLASDDFKVWERISQEENGEEILPDDCGMENYLIFLQGSVGQPKPLLYAYNPLLCDSLDFCDQHPDFCEADTTLCNAEPDFCESLADGVLYIGSWYAKEPFIKNDRSDTLVFEINNKLESIFVTNITSQNAIFQYKNRFGIGGEVITEIYKFSPPTSE
ncbi:MAG: hypothetical protein KAI99_02245 [Cyclobacteriaceae bacterium]|nr:hypothetical protein [Cyclobacteriaceae bacterium]